MSLIDSYKYYSDDFVTLLNGDCIDVMKCMIDDGIKVDKVITSPPYNITPCSITQGKKDRGYDVYKDYIPNEDYIKWTIEIFNCYEKILNPNGCIAYNMSYGTRNTELMSLTVAEIIKQTNFTLADILVWKKRGANPNHASSNKMTRICEFVYIFCRRSEFNTFTTNKKMLYVSKDSSQEVYENVFNFFQAPNNNEVNDLNKATFSTQFVDNIIDRYVRKDDIVLDNFSGTGTTMCACKSQGIKSIGIELSDAQCEHAKQRIGRGIKLSLY